MPATRRVSEALPQGGSFGLVPWRAGGGRAGGGRRAFVSFALSGLFLGCTQTAYDLFPDGSGGAEGCLSGVGGACVPGGGGSGAGGSSGSGASLGSSSGGASGGAEATSCESVLDPTLRVSSLVFVESGLCLSVGAPTTIGEEAGYLTTTMPCDDGAAQRWTVRQADEGSVEIRSELVDMNVDVQLASNEDGTAVILYKPHALYNQRYFPSDVSGDDIRLAARHSPSDCLSERPDPDGVAPQRNVEIWPCSDGDASQLLDIVSCVDVP